MSIIRGNTKLAQFGDSQLGALVASCICLGVDGDQLEDACANWQAGGRKAVVQAACAYDLLVSKLTVTSSILPSEESRLWSDLEGGHIFHHQPTFSVSDLICGKL